MKKRADKRQTGKPKETGKGPARAQTTADPAKTQKQKVAPQSAKRKPKSPDRPATPQKPSRPQSIQSLLVEVEDLRMQIREAEETLGAIRRGDVDALVVAGPQGEQVYTLKGAELPYRILVESMNEGALSLTETGIIVNCNAAFAKLAGTPCGMMIGKSLRDLVEKTNRHLFDLFWKEALEKEGKIELELNFGRRTVPVSLSVSARLIEGETWAFAVVADISRRKRDEAELARYHERLEVMVDEKTEELQNANEELQTINEELRVTNDSLAAATAKIETIFNSLSDAVIFTDENHRIRMINPAAEVLFGYKREDLADSTTELLYAVGNGYPGMKTLQKGTSKTSLKTRELSLLRSDGTVFQGEMREAPIKSAQGGLMGYVAIYRDVTERRLAEEKLRESETRYRLLTEDSPDAIIIHDGEQYLFANSAAVRMLGAPGMEDLVGRNIFADIHPDYRDLIRSRIARKRSGSESSREELKMLRLDGSVFDAEAKGVAVMLEGIRVYQVVIRDITERKAVVEKIAGLNADLNVHAARLEDANKELEAFVYSISHDLRAPLRTMAGFANILREDYADKLDAQARDYLDRIWSGSGRMSRLVEDLLRLSRITRQELNRMDYDLGKLAESVLYNLRESEPGRTVEVVTPQGLRAVVDPDLMKIALANLLDNAWKFTTNRENARIEFGATEQNGERVYFVRDNGAGFDMAYVDNLFWPFRRLHADKEFPGTGIGLTLVERIIRKHGGRIWAEGSVDRGATFYFTLV